MAFCLSIVNTNSRANAFTTSDISLETFASSAAVACGLIHAL